MGDKKPLQVSGGWAWYCHYPEFGWPAEEFDLDPDLWGRLERGVAGDTTFTIEYRLYPTEAEAVEDYNRAAEQAQG